ncbi:MAG: hypothetical protein WCS33_05455 [Candidatus Caldatribacteriota bacterium]
MSEKIAVDCWIAGYEFECPVCKEIHLVEVDEFTDYDMDLGADIAEYECKGKSFLVKRDNV